MTSEYEKDTVSPLSARKVNTEGNISSITPLSRTVFFLPLLTETDKLRPRIASMLFLTSSIDLALARIFVSSALIVDLPTRFYTSRNLVALAEKKLFVTDIEATTYNGVIDLGRNFGFFCVTLRIKK